VRLIAAKEHGMDDRIELVDQAADVAASLPMVTALGDVARDDDLWVQANQDVDAFLAKRGLVVPDRLRVKPIPWRGFGTPSPEWEPFTIRLTMCRRVWIRDENGKYREEQICRGFEVVPNPVPGGPRG
jgi:hypothetical protein